MKEESDINEIKKNRNGILITTIILLVIALLGLSYYTFFVRDITNLDNNKKVDSSTNEDNKNLFPNNIDQETLKKLLPIIGVDIKTMGDFSSVSQILTSFGTYLIEHMSKEQIQSLVLAYARESGALKIIDDKSKCFDISIHGDDTYFPNCRMIVTSDVEQILKNYETNYSVEEIMLSQYDSEAKQEGNKYYFGDASGYSKVYDSKEHLINSWYGYSSDWDKNLDKITATNKTLTIRDEITTKYTDLGDKTTKIVYYEFSYINDDNTFVLRSVDVK